MTAIEKVLGEVCPDWKEKHYDEFTEEEREKWLSLRDRAIPSSPENWFFLANDLLGYHFQQDVHTELFAQFPQFDPDRKKHFFELSEQVKKVMVLWSRGTYKTTAVVVFIIACLLYDPDLVIMIISGSKQLAQRLLKEAKSHFERPRKKFAYLFPEYCRPKLGNMSEFTLECRKDHHINMASVMISSGKSVKAGQHPDLLLVDDLVHELNYKKPELLETCWEDYCTLEPLLNPGGYVIVTGTRYSYGDTYERIEKKAIAEQKEFGSTIWRFSIRNCWKDGKEQNGPFFLERLVQKGPVKKPVGHSMDFLQRMRKTIGAEFFACQYENQPIPGGAQAFSPALLDRQTFHFLKKPHPDFNGPCLPEQGVTCVFGDLAYVGSSKRDKTVFYIFKYWNGQLWVFACKAGNWNTEELTKVLWNDIIGVYRPTIVWIEKTAAYESYDYAFRSYAMQRNIQQYPIQFWNSKGANQKDAKVARIGATQGPLAEGRVWLFSGMDDYLTLREQLEKFPKLGTHDDHADCFGFVCAAPVGWQFNAVAMASKIPEFLRDKPEEEPLPYGSGCGSVIVG